MNVNGTEANTLLTAQIASAQRQTSQDASALAQRDQTLQVQETARQRSAQAPQTGFAVQALETDDSGRSSTARRDLPRDAQEEARRATDRNDGQTPRRGSAINIVT